MAIPEPQIGRKLRGYELDEMIGRGGFGEVYRAYQPVIDRTVAIKMIAPHYAKDENVARLFDLEARLIARAEHPYIVPIHDYWRTPHGAYLVMRYFPNGSLAQRLRENGPLTLVQTALMLSQIAAALDAAHLQRIVHMDVKPANVLLDDEDNAYLTDFGIARIVGQARQQGDAERLMVSPPYTAPEIFTDISRASIQSDIYSLGFVAYKMIAGAHPFGKVSFSDMVTAHFKNDLSTLENVPAGVNAALARATAKAVDARYPTAMAFASDMLDAAGSNGQVTPPPVAEVYFNPFKGLRAFSETDHADFFGRGALVDTLLEHFRGGSNFMAVVGPSGSGKSSVVHAGLLPAIRRAALPRSNRWFIAKMTPGQDPFANLFDALLSVAITGLEPELRGNMTAQPDALAGAVRGMLPDPDDSLLLVIDQFEEVFTQLPDESAQQQFMTLLSEGVASLGDQLRVIIVIRADFYDRPLIDRAFGALMRDNTQVVLPMAPKDIEAAIISPARNAGLEVETALVGAMVADV
ncbi:MAG: serine/threonine-protein kinase, partial [Chloroflexota bacterium]